MITIYKNERDIPNGMEIVKWNDYFFNRTTADRIDERAATIVEEVDHTKLDGKYKIRSAFNGNSLDIDKLSSGCKTILNVLYFPDKVFSVKECGDNALDVLFRLDRGNVFCEYPAISFSMGQVQIADAQGIRTVGDYEELKKWWSNEE